MKRKILIPFDPEPEVKEQKVGSDEPCPICGERLGFPALSRFDNETEICSYCGESEGTGFLFSVFNEKQQTTLRFLKSGGLTGIGLSEWEAHCVVIAAINGSRRGMHTKMKESFEQLRDFQQNQNNMDWYEGDLSD
jgi:hypothetical protein